MELPASPLPDLRTIDLRPDGERSLQAFFDANPLYFRAVHGEPAAPDEAREEIHGELPAGWPYSCKFVFGYEDAHGQLAAMVNGVSDLLAHGVWHLGTFIVATRLHGTGTAARLYASVEAWAQRGGARWMRLGVVQGHARAEAFWTRLGYVQVAQRDGIAMGQRVNTIRVMAKPLTGQPLAEYYDLVERDRLTPPDMR